MSGIIALLTCSIINGHYTFYNFSPQGKSTSSVTVSFLGNTFEAAVYSYIGIALYSCIPTWWSWGFIFAEFFIIVIFRIVIGILVVVAYITITFILNHIIANISTSNGALGRLQSLVGRPSSRPAWSVVGPFSTAFRSALWIR